MESIKQSNENIIIDDELQDDNINELFDSTPNGLYESLLIDVDNRKIEKVDIRELFTKEEINKFIDFGFKFSLTSITNSEKFTKRFFKIKNYITLRATSRNIDYSNCFDRPLGEVDFKELDNEENLIKEYIKEKYGIELNSLIVCGIPDFLVYKKKDSIITDLFFVEAKKRIDSLRFEQMIWIFSNKIPTKIMVI